MAKRDRAGIEAHPAAGAALDQETVALEIPEGKWLENLETRGLQHG